MPHRDPDFAYLAHDLSQLLWAIQGRARALFERLGPEASAARAIAEDAATAAAMLSESGEPVADPVVVAEAAWRQTRDRAAAQGADAAQVTCEGPAAAPPVALPAHALRRILGNLFANAVQAMPEGGRVTWDALREGGRVRIVVQDTGPGVSPALGGRLFTDGASASQKGGHGLGLAGSRVLARRFGGELVLRQTDGGACFEIELPAAPSAPAPARVVDPADRPPLALRILVADDEPPVREMLADLLASEGHATELAADYDAALACWAPGRYDAALIDLGLPGRDGADLARSLRDRDPGLALVMLTGWGRERELEVLDPELADFTATKPIDLPQLRRLLERAARLTAARRSSATFEE